MRLDEGETKNYSESSRLNELAIIDATDPGSTTWSRSRSRFWPGTVVQNPKLPFRVVPREYYANSTIQMRSQAPGAPPSRDGRDGPMVAVTPLEVTYKEDERNTRRRSWSCRARRLARDMARLAAPRQSPEVRLRRPHVEDWS
jgi:hypothetical protein